MSTVIAFPPRGPDGRLTAHGRRNRRAPAPDCEAQIVILPVVRIERHETSPPGYPDLDPGRRGTTGTSRH